MKDTQATRLLSRNEVETRYGITKRFLELAALNGDGPIMIKIGRSVRYRPSDIEAWIKSREVQSTSQTFGGQE